MTDLWLALIKYLIAFVVGIFLGVIFSSGKVHVRGHEVNIPFVDRNSKNFTLVVILMLACSFAAVGITSLQARRQESCNAEFNSALRVRAGVTQDNEALATADRKALSKLFVDLLSIPRDIPQAQSSEMSRKLIQDYNDSVASTDNKRAENQKTREANPIPEPQCGKN